MENQPIIFFDGVCNLCDSTVQFIIRQDKNAIFRFASLQSEYSKETLEKYDFSSKNLKSVVLIHENKIYTHSAAPLEIARLLGGFWSFAYIFKLIPPFLRNAIYNWIAKNRYKWFGEKETCSIPTPELRARFLG
jgi:predicted DCC family thiol-disulfide oxidoreductase YuxK